MLLNVRNVSKSFPGEPPVEVLKGVSLDLAAGDLAEDELADWFRQRIEPL